MKRPPLEATAEGERLAASILQGLDGAWCRKLREMKAELEQLREIFRQAKGRKISNCKTWEQFCTLKLHRTASAVRKLLAEPPEAAEGKQKSAGKTPAVVHTLGTHSAERYTILSNQVSAYFTPLKDQPDFNSRFEAFLQDIGKRFGFHVEMRTQ